VRQLIELHSKQGGQTIHCEGHASTAKELQSNAPAFGAIAPGQAANSQLGSVLSTAEPSGHNLASAVHATKG